MSAVGEVEKEMALEAISFMFAVLILLLFFTLRSIPSFKLAAFPFIFGLQSNNTNGGHTFGLNTRSKTLIKMNDYNYSLFQVMH